MFCGDTAVESSEEDVFPVWLAKKLAYVAQQHHPDSQPSYINYTFDNLATFQNDIESGLTGSGAAGKQLTGAKPTAYKLPDVCVTCNGGWMSRLEDAAKLLMVGLIGGKQKTLDPFDQFILSTWMVKTCLTYDAARGPRLIPEHFGSRKFFGLGYPLPGAHVAVGHDPELEPEGVLLHSRQLLDGDPSLAAALDVNAVKLAFQFDHLILQAIINLGEDLLEHPEHGCRLPLDSPYWEQVWPPRGRLWWPADAALVVHGPTSTAGKAEKPGPDSAT